jgi:putative FmdB family regulatory protein
MPVYEFECKSCGRALELLVRSNDLEKPRCSCGSLKLKKTFSAAAIVTKAVQKRTHIKSPPSCNRSGGCGCH